VPLQPCDVIVVCLLACALVGVPATIAYFVWMLRKEPPATAAPVDAEPERVGAAPRHGRRRSSHSLPARRATVDLRNRFGRR
jgi:hypothetical protein